MKILNKYVRWNSCFNEVASHQLILTRVNFEYKCSYSPEQCSQGV